MRCEHKLGFKRNYVYVCMHVGGRALGSQERASDPFKLEFQAVIVSCHVGSVNQTAPQEFNH